MRSVLLVYVACGLCWTVYNSFFSEMAEIQIARERERGQYSVARRVLWAVLLAPFLIVILGLMVFNPGRIMERTQDFFRREYLDDPKRHAALRDPEAVLPEEPVSAPSGMLAVCRCGVRSEFLLDMEANWEEQIATTKVEMERLGWRCTEDDGWLCPQHAKASWWTVLAWHWREFWFGFREEWRKKRDR